MTVKTGSAEETREAGKSLAKKIKSGDVICLFGELGAGKTTFVQGLAEGLGITGRIISPTFVIVREQELPKEGRLYHVDLYRLESLSEIMGIGISEMASKKNIVVIEWPEKILSELPKNRWEIYFKADGENSREIKIENLR